MIKLQFSRLWEHSFIIFNKIELIKKQKMSTVSKRRQKLHFLYAGVFSLLSNFDELYKETRTFVFFAMRLCNGHSTQHAMLNIVNDT